MFTVIFCDKNIIKDCEEKYSLFLSPLSAGDYAFCQWNPDGATPVEMMPGIEELVKNKPDWRAVIVLSRESYGYANISKRNPFDFNGFRNLRALPGTVDELKQYRESKIEAYRTALTNPLLRLACWLCEPPIKEAPAQPDVRIEALASALPADYFELLEQENADPYQVESDFCDCVKYSLISEIWSEDTVHFNLPKQVICIAERHFDSDRIDAADAWKNRDEFEYRDFIEPNLYPAKLRYLLFDMHYCGRERKSDEYLNFLSFLLIFASNEYPHDAVKAYRIYRVHCDNDHTTLSRALSIYDTKLSLTQSHIRKQIKALGEAEHEPLSSQEMESDFLADYDVTVRQFEEASPKDIQVDKHFVHLATDRPESEELSWISRHGKSKKAFIKFLKEPRRAVRRAAEDVRKHDTFETERVFDMNSFQIEDLEEKTASDELEMVSVRTQDIYDTDAYKKRIDTEGKRVAKHISFRMSAKTILIVTAIALSAYFVGFVPMFFTSLNSSKSFVFSLVLALCAVGLLGIAGMIALIVFKCMLKRDVRNYNIAMSKMVGELHALMDLFSRYLTHVKGFMKRTWLLNKRNEGIPEETMECRILKKHIRDIDEVRNKNRLLFREYTILDYGGGYDPYAFDFSKTETYRYDFPYEEIGTRTIPFIQTGNNVEIPIDFISGITLSREELYE